MTEDFKQGFILGLAQKPLYVAVGPVSKSSIHKFIFKVNGGEEFTFPAIGVTAIEGIISCMPVTERSGGKEPVSE